MIEDIVHVPDRVIIIDERKIHGNDLIHVHAQRNVVIVVVVEKIKNLDDKYFVFVTNAYLYIYIYIYLFMYEA